MGTNFYATSPTLGERLHIGKSSYGWRFAFRAHPNLGIETFDDWIVVLGADDCAIFDQYGKRVTRAELLERIGNKMGERNVGGDRLDARWGMPFYDREFC